MAGIADFCGKPDFGDRFWLTNHTCDSFVSGGEDRLLEVALATEVSVGESLRMSPELLLDSGQYLWRTSGHSRGLYAVGR